jgi:hypothetical protein
MANDELDAIRARDARGLVSGAIEQTGDAVSASIDRRALLAEVGRLRDWQRRAVEAVLDLMGSHALLMDAFSDSAPILVEAGKVRATMDALIEEAGHE